MAKHSPQECEDLGLDAKIPHKKLGVVMCAHNPNAVEVEADDPWSLLTNQPSLPGEFPAQGEVPPQKQ